jgi:hypothetical protein
LSGNGFIQSNIGTVSALTTATVANNIVFVVPRAGVVVINAFINITFAGGTQGVSRYISTLGIDSSYTDRGDAADTGEGAQASGSLVLLVAAGQAVPIRTHNASSTGVSVNSTATASLTYIK